MNFTKENIIVLFKNKYFIISFVFVIWVSFFDQNNLIFHHELEGQKEDLREKSEHYKGEKTHAQFERLDFFRPLRA